MDVMRIAAAVAFAASAEVAWAATVIVYTDPMSLARRTIVLDTRGPDRLLMCMAPPADSGCTEYPVRRVRKQRR
jgi:hypothetical protein